MRKFGYARVSTTDQNLDRQRDALKAAGCEEILEEKVSGKDTNRPMLQVLLDRLLSGDVVVVCELARLSRSTKDLISLSDILSKKGVELISLKENLDTTTATGKLMFGMLSVISQFERDLIRERTIEGLKSARARGRLGGRPKKAENAVERAKKLYDSKQYTVKEIVSMTGISKPTLYRYLKEK